MASMFTAAGFHERGAAPVERRSVTDRFADVELSAAWVILR
jgi:hypothetical protein